MGCSMYCRWVGRCVGTHIAPTSTTLRVERRTAVTDRNSDLYMLQHVTHAHVHAHVHVVYLLYM